MNNTEKLLYWRRAAEVVCQAAALLIALFWKNAPPALAPGLQTLALSIGQSPLGNPTTSIKTMRPPPLPPLPVIDTTEEDTKP